VVDGPIEAVLLDMDGVIADFVTPSLEVAEIPLQHANVVTWNYFAPYMSEQVFIKKINDTEDFWADIKPYPWATELVRMCEMVAPVYFCSNPGAYKGAASAKIDWLVKYGFMGRHDYNYILTPHKFLNASPNRVLIDDGEHNTSDFNKHKGIGVLFPQPWNSPQAVLTEKTRLSHVSSCLEAAVNSLSGKTVYGTDSQIFESILAEAERLTGVDRQADYGPPDTDFIRISGMWTAMLAHKLKEGVKFESWEVAQMMICIKLSRLQHARKRDSVVDIAGYANCMDYCHRSAEEY